MSDKFRLASADFLKHDFWTWDDDADDCSMLPLSEIPMCHNGDIDLGVLFLCLQCRSPDGGKWNSIVGVFPSTMSVYWIHVFSDTGDFAWNLHLPCRPEDVTAFERTFGNELGSVFPLAIEEYIESLDHKLVASVSAPF